MSKHAYQNGVVLMQCDGCKNRHLIADNLGWFRDKRVNIEDLMREKSEELAMFSTRVAPMVRIEQGLRRALTQGAADAASGSPDPAQRRRDMKQTSNTRDRRSVASDSSPVPTCVVRVSNLPPSTTAADISCALAPQRPRALRIKSLRFECDFNLRPLRSARAVFFSKRDAADFAAAANSSLFAGSRVSAEFVTRDVVPNPTRDKYLGGAQDTVVFLYGYPPHVHQHQIRDYYRAYDIVDTTLPGVQPAPQLGHTFLARRGAFLVQLATPAEARRFIRDVYGAEYVARSDEGADDVADARPSEGYSDAAPAARRYTLKALLVR
ncbi:hypothetical protein H4R19_005914 [Coemansia spiralis]|nr:hypothetical protein H4R19_005914 [Coemansia spiralis]